MTKVLHRNMKKAPPVAGGSTGRHVLFETAQRDPDRKVTSGFFDLSSGAAVTGLGHSNQRVKDAMIAQINLMPYVHAAQWSTPAAEEAAYAITSRAGDEFKSGGATFFSGGSEAIEAACKLALQACSVRGKPNPMFIGRAHSYHGGTFFALLLGDHPRRAQLDVQQSIKTDRMYRFDAYAPHLFHPKPDDAETYIHETACIASLQEALETVRRRKGTPIVVMETIGGTTLAISPPTVGYLEKVRELVDLYDGVLIFDEILGGNFRTGHLMAWQWYQRKAISSIAPDIAVMGKGITAGYFPMSCVLVSSKMRYILEHGSGSLWATSTNQNHPIGSAAVCAALDEYEARGADIEHSRNLLAGLMSHLEDIDHVKSVQGVGCLWGVCFNPDRPGLHLRVKQQLFNAGIAVYTDGGTVGGKGNMILVAPPYNLTASDCELVADAIENLKLD